MRRTALATLALLAACSNASDGTSPGDRLGDKGFWSLVAAAKDTGGDAVEDRADALTQALKTTDRATLEAFQQHLVRSAAALNTQALADAAQVVCRGTGDFADFRTWVIAQGQATYDAALEDPDSLAGIATLRSACSGAGGPYGTAAVAPYSDLGFEPGSEAFPLLDTETPPTGPPAGDLTQLKKRFARL
jgi:predicted NodU family carbamoyl transferase